MDPLTAFSLACGVIQVVDFSTEIIGKYRELHKSGASIEYKEMESMANHLTDLATKLQSPSTTQSPGSALQLYHDDRELLKLAQQCSQTANKLIDELQKLSIQGQGRKRDAFRKSIKIIWRSSAIGDIQRSLEQYRRTLDTRVLINLRQHIHLIANEQSDGFRALDRQLQNLIVGISKNQTKFDELKRVLETVDASSKQHITQEFQKHREATAAEDLYKRLVESLYFPDMHARQEGIDQAHEETFEWIFAKQGDNVRPWYHFVDWLENGHGTYWISGKAGSGKSTLMNFIYHNPRTVAALKVWSGNDETFISNFFFWNPGTQLQKSLAGLLRSLIYQIIGRYPYLMPVLAESTVLAQHRLQQLPTWTENRLRAALKSLLSRRLGTDRMCIFIDGLDEFEGDQAILLELIEKTKQFKWIKFCVSSRPYSLFRDGLGTSAMLKLQDLTEPDIRKYVSDRINQAWLKASHTQHLSLRLDDTVERIVERAEGVFLWVRLAVMDQIEGIRDKDDFNQLKRRLEALPDEIEGLYGHMLQKINRVHREEAAQYLQIVLHVKDLSLFDLALGSHKRIDDVLRCSPDVPIRDIRLHCDLVEERVATTCKGLLEVCEIRDQEPRRVTLSDFIAHLQKRNKPLEQRQDLLKLRSHSCCSQVRFLHRSAFEFFTSNEQGKEFLGANTSTNPHPRVLHIKALTARMILLFTNDELARYHLLMIMKAAFIAEKETGVAQPAMMNLVDGSITTLWERSQDWLPDIHWCRKWGDWAEEGVSPKPVEFIGLAICYGLKKYVEHTMGSQPTGWKAGEANYLLACAVGCCHKPFNDRTVPQLELVSLLLERGADSNTKFSNFTAWGYFFINFFHPLSPLYDRVAECASWDFVGCTCGSTVLAFLRSGANINTIIGFELNPREYFAEEPLTSVVHLKSAARMRLRDASIRLQLSPRLITRLVLDGCANFSEVEDAYIAAGAVLYFKCTNIAIFVKDSQSRYRRLDLRLSNQQLDQFLSPCKERLNAIENPLHMEEVHAIFEKQVVDLFQELDIEKLYKEASDAEYFEDDDESIENDSASIEDDDESFEDDSASIEDDDASIEHNDESFEDDDENPPGVPLVVPMA